MNMKKKHVFKKDFTFYSFFYHSLSTKISKRFNLHISLSLFTLFVLFFVQILHGQDQFISDHWTGGSWSAPGLSFSTSAGSSRIIIVTPTTTGNRYWRLRRSSNGEEISPSASCISGQDKLMDSSIGVEETAANSNCTNGAWYVNVSNTSHRYVFKTPDASNNKFIFFKVQGNVQSVSSVSQSPIAGSVNNTNSVTVTATLSSAFSTGQAAYLRYSTDNFSTSTVTLMTGSGTSYSANIPSQNAGTTVRYYVYTSGDGAVGSSNGPNSNGSDSDYRTINLNNNGGSNYSYIVTSLPIISGAKIGLNFNNSGNIYRYTEVQNACDSGSSQWTGSLGTLYPGNDIVIKGGNLVINNTATNTKFFYRIYKQGNTPPSFSQYNITTETNCSSNKKYETISDLAIDKSIYAEAGTYNFEIYHQANVSGIDYYMGMSSSPYIATFIVSPIPTPSAQTSTPVTLQCEKMNLTWTKNVSNHDVMIVRSTDSNFTPPVNGTSYSINDTTLGGDLVIYKGNLTTFEDSGLLSGTTYYYAFYSENYNYYSTAVIANSDTCSRTITITPSYTLDFGTQCMNIHSSVKSYKVSATSLSNNLVITAPANTQISLFSDVDFGSSITIEPSSSGEIVLTEIYVIFTPTNIGAYSQNITHESTGVTSQNVTVNGAGAALTYITNPSTSFVTITEGGTVPTLTATATGAGTISYQWFINTTNSNMNGSIIPNATSNSYTPTKLRGTYYYYATATDNNCIELIPSTVSGSHTYDITVGKRLGLGTTTPGNLLLAIDDSNTGLDNPITDNLSLNTNGISRIQINEIGKIGIHNPTPEATLDINAGGEQLKISHLATSNASNSEFLILDNKGLIKKRQLGIEAGKVIRIGLNSSTYSGTGEFPARFNDHDSDIEMGNSPAGIANFINNITGSSLSNGVSASAGNGTSARNPTDQIILPKGVYRLTIRFSAKFDTSNADNQLDLRIIMNNHEYSYISGLITGTGTENKSNSISETLVINSASTLDFTFIRPSGGSGNVELNSRSTSGGNHSYSNLILIEKVQ